ncbi:digalactosyldiacylglycerol synthase 1 [Striga asiatica]|uniref:Digalactosyldiacylglycerol synthase 1, chloroplastic n=1 Tax=Striga asiatica TaxID=4170 RepID=A0A5A7P8X2_STRAF|nr:digalactosyldiacylglycerol synthase 1 [Striga asiatica]
MNFKPPEAWSASPTVKSSGSSSSIVTAEKALSFISKGWREVRSSADADLQLLKNRANSFKNLADRELENFLNSASKSTFSVPSITASATLNPAPHAEIDFVKKLQPKLSEIRRVYSSPDFKFYQRPQIKIDLSAIKNAIVAEVGEDDVEDERENFRKWRAKFKEREREEGQFGEFWEPIKTLKSRLRELEHKSSSEIFEGIKNSEFVEKFKSSLKTLCKDPNESKVSSLLISNFTLEVLPLDVPELLASLVRQSSPLLDQLGISRGISDKIVESLCSKRKNQLLLRSLPEGESSIIESENINDELDLRIASVLQSTGHCYEGGFWNDVGKHGVVSERKRHVAIVTTASLPWMTGTAVNPLFRAAYLANSAKQNVTLLVPWLCRSDQELVYPNNLTFSSPEEQESYIRSWLEERIGFKADFKISFYPGKFSKARRSIIPAGDTSQFISSKDADIAILEEPEHLNWYHHGKRWTDKFNHVVGVVHTNYLEYIKREKNGALQAFLVKHINNWVVRAYCHKVLRLSAATQDLPKSVICNVHGVNPKFLKIGEKVASEKERGEKTFSKGAYFLGKMVWAKGYKELIDLLSKHKKDLDGFNLDVYGNGEDAQEVQSTAKRLNLNLNFMKGRDHADDSLQGYKIFINPSVSDVLCTATAEALAMGKFVVCADHPSNDFFRAFPNCLTYKTPEDFVTKVREAMASEPQPLTPEQMYSLSWEAATQRFMEYSELSKLLNNDSNSNSSRTRNNSGLVKSISLPNLSEMADGGLALAHYCLTGNEFLRLCTGAIPGTRDYDKQHSDDLGLLPPHVENPIYGW